MSASRPSALPTEPAPRTSAMSRRPSCSTFRQAAWSSTHSTFGSTAGASASSLIGAGGSKSSGVETLGRSIQKRLPISGALLKPISPPINSASSRHNTRPMPVPGMVEFSRPRRWNGWNSMVCCSRLRPGPLSATHRRTAAGRTS
ncbi:hypothetical protein FQZ97_968200 [compost metagenome]